MHNIQKCKKHINSPQETMCEKNLDHFVAKNSTHCKIAESNRQPTRMSTFIKIKEEKVDKESPTMAIPSSSSTMASTPVPPPTTPQGTSAEESMILFEKRVLELAKEFQKGIPDKILKNEMPSTITALDRAAVINKLLGQGVIVLYKQGNELLYRLKAENTTEPEQMKDADKEEKVVYDIIKEANNMGIWIRDIRVRSNLMMPQLNKIVKLLETKKLIKAVKSVAASKKKVYMLYNIDPHRSLTGGAWYSSDQDFESEFVTVLNQQCYKYLSDKRSRAQNSVDLGPRAKMAIALTTLEELWKYICKLGISKVDLAPEDIKSILNTLIYDGKVEKIEKADLEYYLAAEPMLDTTGLTQVPCGVCPVAKDCSERGVVNPGSCIYINSWLAYEF